MITVNFLPIFTQLTNLNKYLYLYFLLNYIKYLTHLYQNFTNLY